MALQARLRVLNSQVKISIVIWVPKNGPQSRELPKTQRCKPKKARDLPTQIQIKLTLNPKLSESWRCPE